jgi:CheY-like chemotaxis protein
VRVAYLARSIQHYLAWSLRFWHLRTREGPWVPIDYFEQKSVLVVEDNDRLRATVGELLRWHCYRVNEAADGAEALAVAAEVRPDVIVTDLNMPVMDGATFIQQCRRTAELDNVPIVVMSGQDESDVIRGRLRAARVSAYLVKPFGVEELSTAVEGHLPSA